MLSSLNKAEHSGKTDSLPLSSSDLIFTALWYGDISYFEQLLLPPKHYHGSHADHTNEMLALLEPYLASYLDNLSEMKYKDDEEKEVKKKNFYTIRRLIETREEIASQKTQPGVCSSDSESSDCSKSIAPGIGASDSGDSDLSPGADCSAQPSSDFFSSRNSASLSPSPDTSELAIKKGRTSSASTVPHNQSPPQITGDPQRSVSQKSHRDLDRLECQSPSHNSGVSEDEVCRVSEQYSRDYDCQSPLLGAGFHKKTKNEIEEEDGPCLGCVVF